MRTLSTLSETFYELHDTSWSAAGTRPHQLQFLYLINVGEVLQPAGGARIVVRVGLSAEFSTCGCSARSCCQVGCRAARVSQESNDFNRLSLVDLAHSERVAELEMT